MIQMIKTDSLGGKGYMQVMNSRVCCMCACVWCTRYANDAYRCAAKRCAALRCVALRRVAMVWRVGS